MATEVEIAWLAGLFEGEGCISIEPRSVRLTVRMTDRDVVERINHIFPSPGKGISTVRPRRPGGGYYKTQHCWRTANAAQVREILSLISPWLGERRASKAAEALAFLDARPGVHHAAERTHCKYGHPFDEANTHRDVNGYRDCRACRRVWARESKARTGYRWLGDPTQCPVCGAEFRPARRESKTCSISCGATLRWITRRANAAA